MYLRVSYAERSRYCFLYVRMSMSGCRSEQKLKQTLIGIDVVCCEYVL